MKTSVPLVKLGELVEGYSKRCGNPDAMVAGVDINKQFIATRANLLETDVSKYYEVPPFGFACNLMHIGRDERLPIAYNQTDQPIVVTSAYYVFIIKESVQDCLIAEYLYMILSRAEFDRLTWFCTDSSVRGNLRNVRFLEIEIPLPSIEVQREMVDAWQGLRKVKEENEQLAEPLLQLCKSYLQDCKKKYPMVEIGPMIEIQEARNQKGENYPFIGVNKNKAFMPTVADTSELDNTKYKVVGNNMFVFSGMQTGRDMCIRLALHDATSPILVSPAYTTFVIAEVEKLLPTYLYLYFCRAEMDRLGAFFSDSSVRSNLDWTRFCNIKIPLPPIEVQQAVVGVYKCAMEAKRLAEEADKVSREMCSPLIQSVIRKE